MLLSASTVIGLSLVNLARSEPDRAVCSAVPGCAQHLPVAKPNSELEVNK